MVMGNALIKSRKTGYFLLPRRARRFFKVVSGFSPHTPESYLFDIPDYFQHLQLKGFKNRHEVHAPPRSFMLTEREYCLTAKLPISGQGLRSVNTCGGLNSVKRVISCPEAMHASQELFQVVYRFFTICFSSAILTVL